MWTREEKFLQREGWCFISSSSIWQQETLLKIACQFWGRNWAHIWVMSYLSAGISFKWIQSFWFCSFGVNRKGGGNAGRFNKCFRLNFSLYPDSWSVPSACLKLLGPILRRDFMSSLGCKLYMEGMQKWNKLLVELEIYTLRFSMVIDCIAFHWL